jgi:sec-independent protein translocase protein TatA
MVQSLGAPELLIVLIIVIIIFGAGRIGRLGKEIGTAVNEFRAQIQPDEDIPASFK